MEECDCTRLRKQQKPAPLTSHYIICIAVLDGVDGIGTMRKRVNCSQMEF